MMTKEQVLAEITALSETDAGWVLCAVLRNMSKEQIDDMADHMSTEHDYDLIVQGPPDSQTGERWTATRIAGGPPRAPVNRS